MVGGCWVKYKKDILFFSLLKMDLWYKCKTIFKNRLRQREWRRRFLKIVFAKENGEDEMLII